MTRRGRPEPPSEHKPCQFGISCVKPDELGTGMRRWFDSSNLEKVEESRDTLNGYSKLRCRRVIEAGSPKKENANSRAYWLRRSVTKCVTGQTAPNASPPAHAIPHARHVEEPRKLSQSPGIGCILRCISSLSPSRVTLPARTSCSQIALNGANGGSAVAQYIFEQC